MPYSNDEANDIARYVRSWYETRNGTLKSTDVAEAVGLPHTTVLQVARDWREDGKAGGKQTAQLDPASGKRVFLFTSIGSWARILDQL